MNLSFYKMQGCGNDFLLAEDFGDHGTDPKPNEIRYLCDRHFGIGADGLVILRQGEKADASWRFFNSDGSEAEMCGNAARCAIRLLTDRASNPKEVYSLETLAGVVRGRVMPDGLVEITMSPDPVERFEYDERILEAGGEMHQAYCLNTGVPHAVIEVKTLKGYPVERVGRQILNHPAFAPEKTNVTFFQRAVGSTLLTTTFERGVEKETLACGTGAAAAAIIFTELYLEAFPILLKVPGGDLVVDISPVSKLLLLRGPANYVMTCEVDELPTDFETGETYGSGGSST